MVKQDDRIVKELEAIRDKLYREQPDTMGTVEMIIDLLQYILCDHEWESRQDPNSPGESYRVCKKCDSELLPAWQ